MRSWVSVVLVACGGLLVFACGGAGSDGPRGGGGSGGTILDCATLMDRPPGCDDVCPTGSDSECELGTFCLSGVCSAQCNATEGCGGGSSCNTRGRCVPDMNTGGMGGTGGGNACQSITITPTRSTPNVMFLVDQSGSMPWCLDADQCTPPPGELDRWEAAHRAIMGDATENPPFVGIVEQLDSIVRFGLTTYQSNDGFGPMGNRECPLFDTEVSIGPPQLNFNAIDAAYPQTFPGGEDTPTGDSIVALVGNLQTTPPPADGPTIIVLATDGAPDSCEYPDPSNNTERAQAEGEAETAAGASHDAGIDLFVLWVGKLADPDIRAHIQDVANAGVGNGPTDPDAPFWVGENPQGLATAVRDIISASISCDIQMDRRFDNVAKACAEGDVRLNGNPLDCPSEWRVKPGADDVIELVGDACDTLKSGDVTFTASFPCGAILVE